MGLGLGLLCLLAEARLSLLGLGLARLYPAGTSCRSGNLCLASQAAVAFPWEGKDAIKG